VVEVGCGFAPGSLPHQLVRTSRGCRGRALREDDGRPALWIMARDAPCKPQRHGANRSTHGTEEQRRSPVFTGHRVDPTMQNTNTALILTGQPLQARLARSRR
jgi:hypothetical protein